MTDKPTPTTDLLKRCAEIHEWRSTGVLSGEALRDYAKRKWPDLHDTLQMAEHETVTEALALLAKWGQPAQAAEPVAYLTRNAEGDPAMLFFDKDEASTYCEDGVDPAPLFTAPAAPDPHQSARAATLLRHPFGQELVGALQPHLPLRQCGGRRLQVDLQHRCWQWCRIGLAHDKWRFVFRRLCAAGQQ